MGNIWPCNEKPRQNEYRLNERHLDVGLEGNPQSIRNQIKNDQSLNNEQVKVDSDQEQQKIDNEEKENEETSKQDHPQNRDNE